LREEGIYALAHRGGGALTSASWRVEVCRAQVTIASLGDQLRLSWPAASCGQETTSAGSTLCQPGGDGAALTCGATTYRRE
jgi:hypothetical protein